MSMSLYDTLTPWYHLLDPREDHASEAAHLADTIAAHIDGPRETLLELGAGAGNNASFLKERHRCTLTDPSAPMRALSERVNPECEHLPGDMRSLRLGRVFDAVVLHDAIVYMTTREDLRAAMRTAFVHTRAGGVAIFAPDTFAEVFHEYEELHTGEDGERSMRCLEWCWDPTPNDEQYVVEWALLLRRAGEVTAVHDRHVEGLFSRAVWLDLAASVGFVPRWVPRPLEDLDDEHGVYAREILVAQRPDR